MRVAYVCTDPGIPVFGRKGASVHVQAVLRVLVARGAEVHLITPRPGGAPPAGMASVRVVELPPVAAGDPAARERSAQRSDAAVAEALTAAGPVDLVYERYGLWGVTATSWAAEHDVPSVLEVNSPLIAEQRAHRALVDGVGAEAAAVSAFTRAGSVVCVSDEVAAWVRTLTDRPHRVHTVPNGVDIDRHRPAARPVTPASGTTCTVGFVGTLKPWHGVEHLVDAVALLRRQDPTYRLLLVGDGPEAAALRDRGAAAGLGDALEMTGAVAPEATPALLHRMDVAVAPYPPLDPFYFSPLKVYEYLAAGVPVVASRIGQVPAALDGGRLGALVPPGDPRALAAAVADLRADTPRRTALRAAGRRAAVDRHSWDGVVTTILDLVGAARRAGV